MASLDQYLETTTARFSSMSIEEAHRQLVHELAEAEARNDRQEITIDRLKDRIRELTEFLEAV